MGADRWYVCFIKRYLLLLQDGFSIFALIPFHFNRAGVAVGMGMAGLEEIVDCGVALRERGYRRVNPHFIPKILINMAAGHISLKYGLKVYGLMLLNDSNETQSIYAVYIVEANKAQRLLAQESQGSFVKHVYFVGMYAHKIANLKFLKEKEICRQYVFNMQHRIISAYCLIKISINYVNFNHDLYVVFYYNRNHITVNYHHFKYNP